MSTATTDVLWRHRSQCMAPAAVARLFAAEHWPERREAADIAGQHNPDGSWIGSFHVRGSAGHYRLAGTREGEWTVARMGD